MVLFELMFFSIDSLRCLTGLEKLTSLRLKEPVNGLSNPVCMNSSYRSDMLKLFPRLVSLDGECSITTTTTTQQI